MTDSPLTIRQAELEALEIDARRFAIRDRPGSDALWISLQKPRNRILRRWREALDQMTPRAAEQLQQGAAGLLGADGNALIGPLGTLIEPADDGPPALISVADAMVAQAILGNGAVAEAIMNRIEGRVGVRKDDADAEQVNRRGEMILAVEETVRLLQERPGDKAQDITPAKAKNGGGVTDVEIEEQVRRFQEQEPKPNGTPPKKPPNGGSGFTS